MAATLCSVNDVILDAGRGASGALTASGAMVEAIINKSEGVICGASKRNWVVEYSSVSSTIKELLKSCCSAHAAHRVVKYDMSGYFSRQEAEIILDVLHDEFLSTLKNIQDLDTINLRGVND